MQQSQRVRYNQVLEYAILHANRLGLPLLVCYIFTKFPKAQNKLQLLILEKLIYYDKFSNDPSLEISSYSSPYIQFG